MPEKTKSTKSKKAAASSPATKKVTKQLPFRSKETITTSDEESSDDEQSEGADAAESPESESESSESEEPAPVKAKKSAQEAATTKPKSTTPIVPPASGDYRPPEDFTRISKRDVPSSNPFSATNLEGKEIWYITAPANVSLSALASVNPVDVAEGNPVMEVDGRRYCLRPEEDANTDESGVGLLVADSTGQYRAAKKPIAKKFTIVETLGRSYTIPNDHVPKPKPVREQPKGLKQRFTPIGADLVRNSVAEADKMDIDEPAEPAVKAEGKKKKHKSSHGDDESGEKRKKKKSKKEAVP